MPRSKEEEIQDLKKQLREKGEKGMGCLGSKPDAALVRACVSCSSARSPGMACRRSDQCASMGVHSRAALAQEPPAAKVARVETAAQATENKAKAATAAAPSAKKEDKKEFSWEKKKPDPKDFMFSNLKGQVCDSGAGGQQCCEPRVCAVGGVALAQQVRSRRCRLANPAFVTGQHL